MYKYQHLDKLKNLCIYHCTYNLRYTIKINLQIQLFPCQYLHVPIVRTNITLQSYVQVVKQNLFQHVATGNRKMCMSNMMGVCMRIEAKNVLGFACKSSAAIEVDISYKISKSINTKTIVIILIAFKVQMLCCLK